MVFFLSQRLFHIKSRLGIDFACIHTQYGIRAEIVAGQRVYCVNLRDNCHLSVGGVVFDGQRQGRLIVVGVM